MHRTYGPPAAICALILCFLGFIYQAHAEIFTVAPRQNPGDCLTDPNGVCCASGSLGDPNDPCVPAHYCALNDALGAVQVGFGDTVIVMPGTYYENVNMKNDVRLLGSGPAVTIIDGCASGPVIGFSVNGGPDTVVSGFTIRNGRAEKGGGLSLADTSGPSVNGGQQVITRNVIEGSTTFAVAGIGGVGGGIAVYRQSPTITNNLIRNNDAEQFGGGMSLSYSSAVITNNTITGNTVTSVHNPPTSISVGGGIDLVTDYFNTNLLSNNIIEGNNAGTGGGIYQLALSASTITNRYSAFSGNTGGNCDTDDFVCTGSGNISSSCQFVNSGSGDHRLLFGSPCIDTGNDTDAPGDGVDLVDELRILDGDNNFTATIDRGAIEHCENDPDGDTVSNCTDNCLTTSNTLQLDDDLDGVGDLCDNCMNDANADQLDGDSDTVGDVCDNCASISNSNQNNLDGDSQGDACDDDDDNDGIDDGPDTNDTDPDICGDSDLDTCDDCAVGTDDFGPLADNLPANDGLDTDSDGECDAGDTDDDGDTIPDGPDNCPLVANTPQTNTDGDSEGDACDDDDDNDTVLDVSDNCPLIANLTQDNFDGDSEGDICDDDDDNDGIDDGPDTSPNDPDVCGDSDADTCEDCSIGTDDLGPLVDSDPNNDGLDTDSDGLCDVFDDDDDNDTVLDGADNCPLDANTTQDDTDVGGGDGVGDVCDNCPVDPNPTQDDTDVGGPDGWGDVCDNCPVDANPSQSDIDTDTIGDACDLDVDGDTVLDDGDLDGNPESPGGICRSTQPLTSGCDDCDQDNATVWALAGQVPNLHWTSSAGSALVWDAVNAADFMTYSVLRGRLSVMRGDGNITGAICLVKDITNLQYNAGALPTFSGPDGHYYLIGAENSCDPFPHWGTGNDSGVPSGRLNPQCDFGFPF